MPNQLKSRRNAPFKKLIIKKDYKDFDDFYDSNKQLIYKSIIELFSEFKKTRKKTLTLYLSTKIQELIWDTEFHFSRSEYIILTRDVMPFFEKIEDYETCGEIIKIHNDLIK